MTKKFGFAFALALLLLMMNSCAGRNEDPQMEGAARPDTAQSDVVESIGTGTAPQARQHADPEREYYILPSDSVRLTRDDAAVWIMVRGQLIDGCQRYEYYDSVALDATLYLTFWGSRPTDSTVVCTQQRSVYDKELRIENAGYTSFGVIQPDGTTRVLTISEQKLDASL
jgi:hypothetical protein